MKKEGKNIDDLLNEKFSSAQYPFKEAYWQGAKGFMASNAPKAAFNWVKFVYLSTIVVSMATAVVFGVLYFNESISNNKLESQSQNISSINNVSNNQEKNDLTNEIETQTNNSLATIIGEKEEEKSSSLKLENNTLKPEPNKQLAKRSSSQNNINPRETLLDKNARNTNNQYSQSLKNASEVTEQGDEINTANFSSLENLNSPLVTDFRKDDILKVMPFYGLCDYSNSNSILTKEFEKTPLIKTQTNTLVLGPKMVLMPGEETGELGLGLGFGVEYRKNLLKNFSVGVGADFMTYQTKDLFGITRINSIEVENEIVEQQPKITETSQMVNGYYFNNGVAFSGLVEETTFDTTYNMITRVEKSTVSDTTETNVLHKHRAKYLTIPINIYYSLNFGRFDPGISVGSSFSQKIGGETAVGDQVPEKLFYPNFITDLNGGIVLGYYFSPSIHIELRSAYQHRLNPTFGSGKQLFNAIGLRYQF